MSFYISTINKTSKSSYNNFMAKKLSDRLINLKRIKKIDCRRVEESRVRNKKYKTIFKNTVKTFKALVDSNPSIEDKQAAFSKVDKTVKQICHKGIIHTNKRNRVLSRLYAYAFSK